MQRSTRPLFGPISPFTKVAGIVVLISFLVLVWAKWPHAVHPNENRLRLGEEATAGQTSISIFQTVPLSGRTSEEILDIRKEVFKQLPPLLEKPYVPSDEVFYQIRDGLPWFSMAGFYVYGPSDKSFEGNSAESRGIMNPLIPLVPEFWGLSIWAEKNLHWAMDRITDADLASPEFPFAPNPSQLVWNPKERRAEVTYEVSDFLSKVNQWTETPLTVDKTDFGITTYNASDLNFSYVALSAAESKNFLNTKGADIIVPVNDTLRAAKKVCGENVVCNYRSNPTGELDTMRPTELPASAVFYLWESKPQDMSTPPHLKFTINIR